MNYIRKFYYGDIPEDKGSGITPPSSGGGKGEASDWPLWEVFIRPRSGLPHKHCGSVHAADAELAVQAARDVYTRRGESVTE